MRLANKVAIVTGAGSGFGGFSGVRGRRRRESYPGNERRGHIDALLLRRRTGFERTFCALRRRRSDLGWRGRAEHRWLGSPRCSRPDGDHARECAPRRQGYAALQDAFDHVTVEMRSFFT